MGFIRNLLSFALLALIVTGCGGGSSALSSDPGGASGGGTGGSTGGGTGSLTLQWVAPSTFADGTSASLSQIKGYRLYYGTSATDTPNHVDLGSDTQYQITLPSGSYYFRISAIDSNGLEGLLSAAIQKSI